MSKRMYSKLSQFPSDRGSMGHSISIPLPLPIEGSYILNTPLEAFFKMAIPEDFGKNPPHPPRKSKPF